MKVESRTVQVGLVLASLAFTLGVGPSFAGDNGKLTGFLQQYDRLKADTIALMDNVRRTRLDSRASDRKPILELRREVMDFCFDVRKYIHERDVAANVKGVTFQERSSLFGLAHSCEAMEKILETEFDFHRGADKRSDVLIQIQAKYEEVWKLADNVTAAPADGLVRR